jgi:hypothetical protein
LGSNTIWKTVVKSVNGKYSSLADAEAAAKEANDATEATLRAEIYYWDNFKWPLTED